MAVKYDISQEFRPFLHGRPDPEGLQAVFRKLSVQYGVRVTKYALRRAAGGDIPKHVRQAVNEVIHDPALHASGLTRGGVR